tara:strand:- start:1090 stop:1575 length:486 start_codon:yes stop_codon:yes gene_type:complete
MSDKFISDLREAYREVRRNEEQMFFEEVKQIIIDEGYEIDDEDLKELIIKENFFGKYVAPRAMKYSGKLKDQVIKPWLSQLATPFKTNKGRTVVGAAAVGGYADSKENYPFGRSVKAAYDSASDALRSYADNMQKGDNEKQKERKRKESQLNSGKYYQGEL